MKKILLFCSILLITYQLKAQLNYENIIELSGTEIATCEDFFLNAFGMRKVQDQSKGQAIIKKFMTSGTNMSNTMIITLLNDGKSQNNMVDILYGAEIDDSQFKSKLLLRNYSYNGTKEISGKNVHTYHRDKIVILISTEANSTGVKQITLIPEQ